MLRLQVRPRSLFTPPAAVNCRFCPSTTAADFWNSTSSLSQNNNSEQSLSSYRSHYYILQRMNEKFHYGNWVTHSFDMAWVSSVFLTHDTACRDGLVEYERQQRNTTYRHEMK